MSWKTDTGLGERVRRERKKNLLTQKELAEKAGLSEATVWQVENGRAKVGVKALRKLCTALDIDPEKLITYYG